MAPGLLHLSQTTQTLTKARLGDFTATSPTERVTVQAFLQFKLFCGCFFCLLSQITTSNTFTLGLLKTGPRFTSFEGR